MIEGGGGVSYTMNRTVVDLVDVNGDGLPDAVMKIPDDNNSPLRVRLNLGTRFDTEQTWTVPGWGVNVSDWGSGFPALTNALGSADTLGFRRNQSTNINVGFLICVMLDAAPRAMVWSASCRPRRTRCATSATAARRSSA